MSLFDGTAPQCVNVTSGKAATFWHQLSPLLEWIGLPVDGFPLLSALIRNHKPSWSKALAGSGYLPSVKLTACRWQNEDVCQHWKPPPPPISFLERPREIMKFDAVISRLLRRLCFSDVIYLVLCQHPVMMTCHSSLFCALYLYMIRLLLLFFPPLYFFGFIIHFFCAIPATNEKIKTRNILCALWEFTRQGYNDEEQNVLCYVLNALTQILLFPCLVSTRHSCPYSFSKRKPSYSHSDHLSPTQRTFNKSFCVVQIVPLTVLPSLWFFCACFPLTVESMQVDCGEKRTSEGKTEA